MINSQSKMVVFLVLFLIFLGNGGCNRNNEACNQEGKKLYQGNVLLVMQTESEIVVKNISRSPIAIRISWDKGDPHGTGQGEDSFINNWVTPKKCVSQKFKNHTSSQIWAWGTSSDLIDSCSFLIN